MQPTTIPRIHLIEYRNIWRLIDEESGIWESGYWSQPDIETARTLIGGSIFFHLTMADRSYMSGEIIGVRPATDNEPHPGSTIFIFKRDNPDQRVAAGTGGWQPPYRPYFKIVR